MTAAPAPIPAVPFGAKGCQFCGCTLVAHAATKKSSTPTLMTTIAPLKRADSRTPHTSRTVSAATTAAARPLKTTGTPRRCGAPSTMPPSRDAVR